MRATLGITTVMQGGVYLTTAQNNPTIWTWILGLLAITGGVLLLVGFLTPVISSLACLSEIGTAFSILPESIYNLQGSGTAIIYMIIVAAAVVLLGPGAISLDARLFGRREIIIPHNPREPKF